MTIYVYHGYKNGKRVALLEYWPESYPFASASLRRLSGSRTFAVGGIYRSIRAAKDAWRRIDGSGTKWRAT